MQRLAVPATRHHGPRSPMARIVLVVVAASRVRLLAWPAARRGIGMPARLVLCLGSVLMLFWSFWCSWSWWSGS